MVPAKTGHQDIICLRKFVRNGLDSYLVIDPQSMAVQVMPGPELSINPLTWPDLVSKFKSTPYIKALEDTQRQSFSLQDAGIIHGYPKEHGITLTIYLCPSHKPLDRIVFTSLITEFGKTEKPVPLALSITGRLMVTHQDDINWLKNLVNQGDLTITWINHHYNPKLPLIDNFLLEPGTDLDFELLGTKTAMLQHGLVPSIFFRFRGLVSDNAIVKQVTAYGLIPIGSDAWLAKGQAAKPGSIVLIHGNGNEPSGVKDFINLLAGEKKAHFP